MPPDTCPAVPPDTCTAITRADFPFCRGRRRGALLSGGLHTACALRCLQGVLAVARDHRSPSAHRGEQEARGHQTEEISVLHTPAAADPHSRASRKRKTKRNKTTETSRRHAPPQASPRTRSHKSSGQGRGRPAPNTSRYPPFWRAEPPAWRRQRPPLTVCAGGGKAPPPPRRRS